MSESAEEFRERVRSNWRTQRAAYRQRHPDKAAGQRHAYDAACRLLRDTFRDEYDAAVTEARKSDPGPARQTHYRTALAVVRENHPDAWLDCLATTKETA